MKLLIIFLTVILFGFITINCSLTQEQFEKSHWDEKTQGPIPTFIETKIEILKIDMLPDSGAYYFFRPSGLADKIIDVNNKLRRLYVMGFDITMAWYRPPLGGCQRPGSDAITTTMYPEFLLIRLPKANESLEEYNFIHIEHKKDIKFLPCPYDVSCYLPNKIIL